MNEEIEFLEYIYQNAKMGQESVARLIKTRNRKDELEDIVKDKYNEYRKISNSAKTMIERRKKKVQEIGIMAKIATYMGIKINVVKDDSIPQIALMLVEGSKVGIEQINKNLKESNIKNKNIINLTNRLLDIEKNSIVKLEKYIKNIDI